MICNPMGNPSEEKPQGTDAAGFPERLKRGVHRQGVSGFCYPVFRMDCKSRLRRIGFPYDDGSSIPKALQAYELSQFKCGCKCEIPVRGRGCHCFKTSKGSPLTSCLHVRATWSHLGSFFPFHWPLIVGSGESRRLTAFRANELQEDTFKGALRNDAQVESAITIGILPLILWPKNSYNHSFTQMS